jgi:ATP-dependent Clp protease protease subunit
MFFPPPPTDPLAAILPRGPVDPQASSGNYQRQRQMSLADLLLENRILFVGSAPETGGSGVITDYLANITIQRLIWLVTDKKSADIHLYINSPGGSVTAGMAIYDTMQFVTCPVATYCIGLAASMGAMLLTAGETGKRFALPNAEIMIHQPLGGYEGTAVDIDIHVKNIRRMKAQLNGLLKKHTGKTLEQVEKDTDRDNFMTAAEARDYGLIDGVLERMPDTMARPRLES